MSDRIPGEVLRQAAELQPPDAESAAETNESAPRPDRERIPKALRDRAAARSLNGETAKPSKRKAAASGARILAAGFSVAAGVGLVGAMAATAAAANQPQPTPVLPPVQRVVIIEQPASLPVVASLPAPVATTDPNISQAPVAATASTTTSSTSTVPATAPDPQPMPMPTVRVVETAPAPTPVTTSEGS